MPTSSKTTNDNQETDEKMDEQAENIDINLDKGELPKGFFDDPMLDAKVGFAVLLWLNNNCIMLLVNLIVFCMYY